MKKIFAILLCLVLLLGMTAALAETTVPTDIAVGDIVTFGHYEQDNDTSNGQEVIEWIVLEVDDGKALLLSKYGLDRVPYNTEGADITWENCTLRKWLNDDFMNAAFTADEQGRILLTDVDNSKSQGNSEWDTSGGNDTKDKIFLLSCAQANQYLGVTSVDHNNTMSRVAPTAYAIARGARGFSRKEWKTAEGEASGVWWLRSPGDSQLDAASVGPDGSQYYGVVNRNDYVVRPALLLRLD